MLSNAYNLSEEKQTKYKQYIQEIEEFLEWAENPEIVDNIKIQVEYHEYTSMQAVSKARLDLKFFQAALKNYEKAKSGATVRTIPRPIKKAKKLIVDLYNQGMLQSQITEIAECTHQDIQIIITNQRPHPALIAKAPNIIHKLKEYRVMGVAV